MPVLPEVDGISMRPAGEPAPADERPEWQRAGPFSGGSRGKAPMSGSPLGLPPPHHEPFARMLVSRRDI